MFAERRKFVQDPRLPTVAGFRDPVFGSPRKRGGADSEEVLIVDATNLA